MKIEMVEVSTNSVGVVTSSSFASIKDLLSQSSYNWGPNALMFENARFEIDAIHNLCITFTPRPSASPPPADSCNGDENA
jgi:hypothetical protein